MLFLEKLSRPNLIFTLLKIPYFSSFVMLQSSTSDWSHRETCAPRCSVCLFFALHSEYIINIDSQDGSRAISRETCKLDHFPFNIN